MANQKSNGLGLDNLGDLSSFLDIEATTGNGKPLDLDIGLIDEDPYQPRNIFTNSTLKELAASIEKRGVKSPISVRCIDDGRYMINHGARRFRASIMAGKQTIPAYIDTDYSESDQIIENIHRDNLTPREIAEYIGRQLAEGKTKTQIAKEIGKSGAFVTHHYTLLNLPEELEELYNSGKCNDVTVIYEFAAAYKKHKDEVIGWINNNTGEWNRANVKLFKEYLENSKSENSQEQEYQSGTKEEPVNNKDRQLDLPGTQGPVIDQPQEEEAQEPVIDQQQEEEAQEPVIDQQQEEEAQEPVIDQQQEEEIQEPVVDQDADLIPEPLNNGVIVIEYEGERGELLIDRWPTRDGYCWAEFKNGIIEINMKKAQFVSLIEG